MYRIFCVVLLLAGLAACGGHSSPAPASSTTTPPSSANGGGTTPVNAPAVVNTAAGQTAGGVDITVSTPAAAAASIPNAQDLGVAALTGSGSAFNTGDIIHRGTTQRVLLFGPGLSGAMQITIRGPADIQVSNATSITAKTDNTPGISFTAVVSPTAALGARTVVLQTSQGDVTTFTGGLEVVP